MYLTNERFIKGYAKTQGGAIYWNFNEPEGISTCTFTDNVAGIYGNNVAAQPQTLKIVSEDFYKAQVNTVGSFDYPIGNPFPDMMLRDQKTGGNVTTMYFGLFDKYGNLVKTVNDVILNMYLISDSSKHTYKATASPLLSMYASRGLFKADKIYLTGTPGTSHKILFNTTRIDMTIPSNIAYYKSRTPPNHSLTFDLTIRY